MHKNRRWCVANVDSAEALADKLANYSWCCCCGFELDGFLWLNDATGADGAQEYAVCRSPTLEDPYYRQVESVTASWCSERELLAYIRAIQGDDSQPTLPPGPVVVCKTQHDLASALGSEKRSEGPVVHPTIESPQVHGRCHHCA